VNDKPSAVIRATPADFVVEELPAYDPAGSGDHAFITLRKTGLTTMRAVDLLARALDVDSKDAGHAGLKDRHAVTTQTVSLLFPQDRDLEQAVAALDLEGIEILGATRHEHKIRPGHLRGNRFRITLRELETGADDRISARLDQLAAEGIPNAFGPQRFGRDGTNPQRALAWLSGKTPGPRNRSMQRLLFSSVQSLLFNQVLERRVASGTWNRILAGDLAKKHDSGGLFLVPSAPDELAEASRRAASGQISPTGPIFGAKMRWPEAEVAEIEREVLAESDLDESLLKTFKRLGKGTRRALRMLLDQVSCDTGNERSFLTVSFVLPKGGYATTVLSELCRITDLACSPSPSPSN